MSPVALSLISVAVLLSQHVSAQTSTFPATPLADKRFASPTQLPYKVDTDTNLIRGQQFGFNICNSTTQNQNSNCQTSYLNSLDDFCLWAPAEPNSEVFDKEGEMVAWCTKPGYGTRLIPNGALTGVQFMRTSDYVQVVGFINQGLINLIAAHPGGEMDPHGADLRGNPMGGVVFSNAWSGANAKQFIQAVEWHNFMGNDQFCFKVCDPSKPNAAHFCEHRYDRVGCEINAPNSAQKGTFESCDGDVQDFPGTYTTNGVVTTFTQPPEDAGPVTSAYVARTPSSSNCKSFDSASLYAALATVSGSGAPAASSTSGASGSSTGGAPTNKPTNSPTSSSNTPAPSNAAETFAISSAASLFGVLFAAIFFS